MKYSYNSLLFSIIFFYITFFIYGTFFYQLYNLYNYFRHNKSCINLNTKKPSQKYQQGSNDTSTDNKYKTAKKNIIDKNRLSEEDIEKIFILNFHSEKPPISKKFEINISTIKPTKKKLLIQKKKKKLIKKKSLKSSLIEKLPNQITPLINDQKNIALENNKTLPKNISPINNNTYSIKDKISDINCFEPNPILDGKHEYENNYENNTDSIIIDYVSRILKKIYCYIGKKTNHNIVFIINDKNHISHINYTPKKPSLSFKIHIENILKKENIPPKLINQELTLKI